MINENHYAQSAKMNFYKKLDLIEFKHLIETYDNIDRCKENIILCEQCWNIYKERMSDEYKLFILYKYGEALCRNDKFEEGIE